MAAAMIPAYGLLAEEAGSSSNDQGQAQDEGKQIPDSGTASGKIKISKEGGKISGIIVASKDVGDIEIPESRWAKCKYFNSGFPVEVNYETKDGKRVASSDPKLRPPR